MIVFISYPIFDEKKRYRGFVGSAIYLKEKNVINQLYQRMKHIEKVTCM